MKKFMVISSHTAEDCKMTVKEFRQYNAGFFTNFEWGCYDNDHTAYALIQADDHENAKMSVPSLFRAKTRVVQVTNFDPMKTGDKLHL